MGPTPTCWTPFEPDFYLDLRRPEWAEEEGQRWVRYFASEQGAFVYVHALHAKRVVEGLGRLNATGPSRAGLAAAPATR